MARKQPPALIIAGVVVGLGLLIAILAFVARRQPSERVYHFPFQIRLEDDRSQAWNGGPATSAQLQAPVLFQHYQHAIDLKIDCIRCHHGQQAHSAAEDLRCGRCHTEPGLFQWRQEEAAASPSQPALEAPAAAEIEMPFRLRYLGTAHHTLCAGCHQTENRLNPATRAPLTCRGCHQEEKAAPGGLSGLISRALGAYPGTSHGARFNQLDRGQ